MKKNDCNVVRDLMPLVLDRVASDESRELVEEHIESCGECRKQYEEMKAEMPKEIRAEYEEEQRTIVEALRTVKRQQKKRQVRKTVLLAAICMVAVFGALLLFGWLHDGEWPVDNKLYTLSLSRLADGRVILTEDLQFHAYQHGLRGSGEEEDGKKIMYWTCITAPLKYVHDGKVIGKSGFAPMGTVDNLPDEIRQGTPGNYVLIWKKGDPIPAASEEMEAYFAAQDKLYGPDDEDQWMSLDALRNAVPEWQ